MEGSIGLHWERLTRRDDWMFAGRRFCSLDMAILNASLGFNRMREVSEGHCRPAKWTAVDTAWTVGSLSCVDIIIIIQCLLRIMLSSWLILYYPYAPWCWNIYLQNWLINMGFWCWYIFQHHGSHMGSTISITLKQCFHHRFHQRFHEPSPRLWGKERAVRAQNTPGQRDEDQSWKPWPNRNSCFTQLKWWFSIGFWCFLYVYQRVTVRPWTSNPCWVETHLITPSKIWMSGSNC